MTVEASSPGESGPPRVGALVTRAAAPILLGAAACVGGLLVFDAVSPMLGGVLVALGLVVGVLHLVLWLLRRTRLRLWLLGISVGLVLVPVAFFGLAMANLVLHGSSASESSHGETRP